jgi:hypothetical protein
LAKPGATPGPDTLAGRYGEMRGNKITYRPQKLLESGKLSLEDAQNIPHFWATKPNENEYAAAEQLYRQLGKQAGLPTADAQADAWSGAGQMTGLGTVATHTFPELFNERVLFTSRMRGEKPEQTLRDFIRGKKPLLSIAGAAAAGSPLAEEAMRQDEQHKNGGAVGKAVKIARARKANGGGVFAGYIHGNTGGRTDNKDIDVGSGSYVIPADILSGLGEGNSIAGAHALMRQLKMDTRSTWWICCARNTRPSS